MVETREDVKVQNWQQYFGCNGCDVGGGGNLQSTGAVCKDFLNWKLKLRNEIDFHFCRPTRLELQYGGRSMVGLPSVEIHVLPMLEPAP